MKFAITSTPREVPADPIVLQGSPSECFETAKRMGYNGIEMHLRFAQDVDAEEIVELTKRYELPVTTLGTGMAAGIDGLTFSDTDAVVRQQTLERVRGHIDLAYLLGAAVTIGLLNGNLGPDEDGRKRRKAGYIKTLKQCCRYAADAGVTILLEPLNRYECDWLNTTEDALVIMQELDTSNVKYLADTFHMNIEEVDIATSLKMAGAALGYVHLADSNRESPGRGHLPVQSVLHALQEIAYEGYLSFEILPVPNSEQAGKDAIRAVKSILSDVLGRK